MPFTQTKTLKFARVLRREMTAAETRLWTMLRGRRAQGYKFRRQEPLGPYVADFVCRDRQLIVEVDGATHSTAEELARDARRTAWLEAQGFRV